MVVDCMQGEVSYDNVGLETQQLVRYMTYKPSREVHVAASVGEGGSTLPEKIPVWFAPTLW